MKNNQKMVVAIVDFPATKLAVLEHRGHPELLDESIKTFIQWRKSMPQNVQSTDVFNLIYNDPETVKPDDYCLDIGIKIDQDVVTNSYGVITRIISAGRYAVIRHIGSDIHLKSALDDLYNKWLPESGEALRNVPCFFHRINVCPELVEDEQIIDIYLPLK